MVKGPWLFLNVTTQVPVEHVIAQGLGAGYIQPEVKDMFSHKGYWYAKISRSSARKYAEAGRKVYEKI